jgi:hypothetical protein
MNAVPYEKTQDHASIPPRDLFQEEEEEEVTWTD